MKFVPDHDPDPIRRKFRKLASVLDMPDGNKKMWGDCSEKVVTQLHAIMGADSGDLPPLKFDFTPDEHAAVTASLVRFVSYQEMQMESMQLELQNLYQIVYNMSNEKNQTELN